MARLRRRNPSPHRLHFEMLEPRLLLASDVAQLSLLYLADGLPVACGGSLPAIQAGPTVGATASGPATAASPLSSIPALSSLPGATATLYLDFDGHFEAQWGAYTNVSTPVYDQDGDATTFSSAELTAIRQIWSNVAEDYAPFNVNVTTVQPASFANGVALRVAIGGTGTWTGGTYGGIGYVDSYTNSIVNTAHVFSKNLGNGNAKYVADAVSHEAGHGFGLQHQSQYSGTTKVSEYSTGPGDGRAPLLGNSYSAPRSLWWKGTSVAANVIQDDMAVIARSANGFGFRLDDHGDSAAAATLLAVSGTQVSGAGIISTTSDVDYFSFATGAGSVNFSVSTLASGNNLDARLELRNASGVVLASSDPSISFGASITASVTAGTYYLVVASHGSYGDVGQYTVSGNIVFGSSAAPTSLVATATSTSQVSLTWRDNSSSEAGYRVERSLNGTTWTPRATLAANSTSYSDSGLSAGTTYIYRVAMLDAAGNAVYSNQSATTTIPTAPTGLTASTVSSGQINLSWGNVAGETGYQIERSTTGTSWFLVGTTGANVTTYQSTGLSAGTTYYYRVRAVNADGASGYSATANARTNSPAGIAAAPSNLRAVAVSGTQVNLSWQDNSNNESRFVVQRSENNGLSYTTVTRVWSNVVTFSDTKVSRGKTYLYRVATENGFGTSAFSNVAVVATPSASAPNQGAPASSVEVLDQFYIRLATRRRQ